MPFLVNGITDSADQILSLSLPDGTACTLELIFMGSTNRWIFNITHQDFPNGSMTGQMVCNSPNILRNFKNILSFGMACVGLNGLDPVTVNSFANNLNQLYILNAADVLAVEQQVFGAFNPGAA